MTDTIYAVVFDPQGFCTLKGLYKTKEHAKHKVNELHEEHICPCEVIEWEVEE